MQLDSQCKGAAHLVIVLGVLGGCAASDKNHADDPQGDISTPRSQQPADTTETPHWIELQPGVRVDVEAGVVEFPATIAIDCHQPETPDVYLETVCCTPNTREHEALVVTGVRPSSIHAALLAAGASPGQPGAWKRGPATPEPIAPTGTAVDITFVLDPGTQAEAHADPAEWIINKDTGLTLHQTLPETAWVFAGSRLREFQARTVYDADWTGQLIGLHTFGSETIAWTRVEHHDATVQEPLWLADNTAVPPIGSPVTVRLRVNRDPDDITD